MRIPAASFLLGLLATAFAIRIATDALGFGRVTDFDRIVNRAAVLAANDPAPLIILTGTSVSRSGIDDARLTLALRAQGLPHRAINLSLEGASRNEREAHLAAFMVRTNRVPDLVLFELDEALGRGKESLATAAPFSPRAIEYYDFPTAVRSAASPPTTPCGVFACVPARMNIIAHGVFNTLNVGLLSRGDVEARVGQETPFRRGDAADQTIDANKRSDGLSLTIGLDGWRQATETSSPRQIATDDTGRLRQRQLLQAVGIRRVGYYLPPVVDPDIRTVADQLCQGALRGTICIAPIDPVLLDALDRPVWLDETHLLEDGAGVYAGWLAARLARALDTRDRLSELNPATGLGGRR